MKRRRKFSKGKFRPKNPGKYVGKHPIIYRSSWELVLMNKFDEHPNVTQWASESVKIRYWNPLKKGAPGVINSVYVPDFLVKYVDKYGKERVELIEVKPLNQTFQENAKGIHNKIAVAVNKQKWDAARKWAKDHGITFRVITEADMFIQAMGQKKKKKKKLNTKKR